MPGTPRGRRVAPGFYKAHVARLPYFGARLMDLAHPLRDGQRLEGESAVGFFFLGSSDLWKPLSAAYGKCDCMVEGKYKKARVFAFETPSLYVWCHTETGDRGTTWLLAERSAKPRADVQGGYTQAALGQGRRAELEAFFQSVLVGMALASEQAMGDLADYPPVRALVEARELRSELAEARAPSKRRAPGL